MTRFRSFFRFDKIYFLIILIFFAELFSLFGYLIPVLEPVFFVFLVLMFIFLSLKDLRYGLFILLAELFIGSFGHIFSLSLYGQTVSIRVAFWLIILGLWVFKKLYLLIRKKSLELDREFFKENIDLIIFLAFPAYALLNGLANRNGLGGIFLDFNGWLYLLLAFPLLDTLKKTDLGAIKNIFLASALWISLETLVFLFLFAHFSSFDLFPIYRWIRDTGIGEITLMPNGSYRIFLQSQIFALAGIFIVFARRLPKLNGRDKELKNYAALKNNIYPLLVVSLFLSSVLISFSRSFFVGLAAGFFFLFLLAVYSFGHKMLVKLFIFSGAAFAISLILLLAIAYFPFPKAAMPFNPGALTDRATDISGEAGASSRWALLPALWEKIKTAPIRGRGFGATVTYKSSDPRVLATNPNGEYTTYAFEWGWLDIWLKLGLAGLLAYLFLILRLTLQAFRSLSSPSGSYEEYKYLNAGIIIGLLSICAVNVFSPYLNHPLGIGYLVLALLIMNITQKSNAVDDSLQAEDFNPLTSAKK